MRASTWCAGLGWSWRLPLSHLRLGLSRNLHPPTTLSYYGCSARIRTNEMKQTKPATAGGRGLREQPVSLFCGPARTAA